MPSLRSPSGKVIGREVLSCVTAPALPSLFISTLNSPPPLNVLVTMLPSLPMAMPSRPAPFSTWNNGFSAQTSSAEAPGLSRRMCGLSESVTYSVPSAATTMSLHKALPPGSG